MRQESPSRVLKADAWTHGVQLHEAERRPFRQARGELERGVELILSRRECIERALGTAQPLRQRGGVKMQKPFADDDSFEFPQDKREAWRELFGGRSAFFHRNFKLRKARGRHNNRRE